MYGSQMYPFTNAMLNPDAQRRMMPAFEEVEGPESIAYIQMPPNDKRVFFDKHLDRFYTVETDAAGQKAVRSYDFTETVAQQPTCIDTAKLDERFSALEKRLNDIEQLVLE